MNTFLEHARTWSRPDAVKLTWRLFSVGLTAWIGAQSISAAGPESAAEGSGVLPVRGLHLSAPAKRDLADMVEFIRDSLPKAGVNTLVLEFDYHFDFKSRPEFADPSALGKDEVQQILKACREAHIELILGEAKRAIPGKAS